MSPRYAMAVDTRRCVGCNACVIACKQENALPPGAFRDWIATETKGVFPHLKQEIRSERCNHCAKPPCVRVCPTGASHVNTGGTVLVSPKKCTGCSACITACPYDARYLNPKGYADKCTLCLHRLKKGLEPACVASCPTRALTFGDLADPESPVARALRERPHKVSKPETGTEPHVFFSA
jgi:Fe-S-cluster-containing dehydrogenase component